MKYILNFFFFYVLHLLYFYKTYHYSYLSCVQCVQAIIRCKYVLAVWLTHILSQYIRPLTLQQSLLIYTILHINEQQLQL